MKWLVTFGLRVHWDNGPIDTFTTSVTELSPDAAYEDLREGIAKFYPDRLWSAWLVCAVPLHDPTQYALNAVAEVVRDLGRDFVTPDPTLAARCFKFARKLQDTIGRVKIEVAP